MSDDLEHEEINSFQRQDMRVAEHTPTPWQRSGVRGRALIGGTQQPYHSIGPDGDPIAFVAYSDRTSALHRETLGNAAFIVKAVNNHDALVKALRHLLDDKDTTYAVRVSRARDVLAAVSGAPKP